jgi:hypothetical protein
MDSKSSSDEPVADLKRQQELLKKQQVELVEAQKREEEKQKIQQELLKKQQEELKVAQSKEEEKQKAQQEQLREREEALKRKQEEIESLRAVEKEKERDSQVDPFLNFLRENGLASLHGLLVEHGVDTVDLLRDLDKEEFDDMVKETGMKFGQKMKLKRALSPGGAKYEYFEPERKNEPGSGLKLGDYTTTRLLGKGNFGEAYQVFKQDDASQYFVLKKQLCTNELAKNSVLKVSEN